MQLVDALVPVPKPLVRAVHRKVVALDALLEGLLDPLQLGDIEVGEHAPAVGQRDAAVLEDSAVRQAQLDRARIGGANPLFAHGKPSVPSVATRRRLVHPHFASELDHLAPVRPLRDDALRQPPHSVQRAVGDPRAQIRIHEQEPVLDFIEHRLKLLQGRLLCTHRLG